MGQPAGRMLVSLIWTAVTTTISGSQRSIVLLLSRPSALGTDLDATTGHQHLGRNVHPLFYIPFQLPGVYTRDDTFLLLSVWSSIIKSPA
jgi:hypothetical protein